MQRTTVSGYPAELAAVMPPGVHAGGEERENAG